MNVAAQQRVAIAILGRAEIDDREQDRKSVV